MSDQFMDRDVRLSPCSLASTTPERWFAGVGLIGTTMGSYFLIAASTWQSLLWPIDAPAYHLEHVDSAKVQFTSSGESFPIDLVGSYDIDRAKSIIAKAPRRSKPVQVAFWRAYADHMEWPRLAAVPDVDSSFPAIVATIDKARGSYLLIDGWHRIDKACAEGQDLIEGFYLTEEETKEVFDLTWKGLPIAPALLPRLTVSARQPSHANALGS